ncbi:ClpP family protease [Kineococcus sp. TBRC 1896]|uniref:ATP-dependent Clp protease proteolytic subunit n=1 Tax=Kineococcus mangrovi TaxID=1660183 RepID=A0ABV4I5G1_9ACTN
MSWPIPYVVESTPRGDRTSDVFSRLLSDRIVFLHGEIDDAVANVVIAQLVHLASESATADVSLYINSPGGSATALTAVYDTMRFIQPDVATFCVGQAASAAAVLLAAGAPGKRSVLEHSRVLLHQPSGGAQGTAADLQIQAKEVLRIRSEIEDLLARHTGRDVEVLRRDLDRDLVLPGAAAVEYGVADRVVSPAAALTPSSGSGPSA